MKQTELSCDVLVAGGGIAGIAAALAAARAGASVLLVEKEIALGGLATLGLVTIYLPLCDGLGRQVVYGIGEELLRLSVRYGAQEDYPAAWLAPSSREARLQARYRVQYNPWLFAVSAEQLLLEAGVQLLYDTRLTHLDMDGRSIASVCGYNKGGLVAIRPAAVVDATGDADLCALAGAHTVLCQAGNALAAWYYHCGQQGLRLRILGAADSVNQQGQHLEKSRFDGLDGLENSRMIALSHQHMLRDFVQARQTDPTLEPVSIPMTMQLRMTRRLQGVYTMAESQVGQTMADSIGMTGDWRKAGPVFELPYRCLYSSRVDNLATAGRCISVEEDLWDVTRVIPACAVTGEAAGTAAALAAAQGVGFARLPVEQLQQRLRQNGQRLHQSELEPL